MTTKEGYKSGRKAFQAIRLKTSVMQLMSIPDDEVDEKLEALYNPLVKSLGQKDADEVFAEAIKDAGEKFANVMDNGMAEIMKNKLDVDTVK